MEARTHKRNDWRKTVTLPKNLQEKRDAMCEAYKQECLDNWHSPGLYLKPDFKKGFEEACNLLLPEIKKLEEALPNIPDDCGEHTHLGTYLDHKGCDFIRETIQSLRDFLGSEE